MSSRISRRRYAPLLMGLSIVAGLASLVEARAQTPAVNRTQKAYPTGDPGTSVILIERLAPAEVRVGEAYSYEVKFTNLTSAELTGLVLTEEYPPNFNASNVQPQPDSQTGNELIWELDRFGPRQSKVIRISGSTNQLEELTFCARVAFSTVTCDVTKVVEPQLSLTKTAPAEVLICDPIPLRFVVTNTGSGVARDVSITDRLPDGWTANDGRAELTFNAGDLVAGQSREFTATVRSARTGEYVNTARAIEGGGLTAEDSAATTVHQPVLAVTKSGPRFRYIGRPAIFQLTVVNEGDAPAANTMLVDAIPAGTEFVEASDDGRYASGRVTWNLGTLAPGAQRAVSLTLRPTRPGTVENTAQATAICAEASAATTMEVKGIPAILLEVVDIHDPIEVNGQETYEITILNQGSANGTNIVVTCTLPAEEQYISSSGPTNAGVAGQTITFAPLPTLAPKAQVKYNVVVKGVTVGDVRFKVSMTSDQVTSPVAETESTHIY
ncbi:MAG: hypothetical protein ABIG44_18450 [Planctomycetota bacterium]